MERGLGAMDCVRKPSSVTEDRVSSSPGILHRPKTLKRTISKCGIDVTMSADHADLITPKKLAPLHEIPSSHHQFIPALPKSPPLGNDPSVMQLPSSFGTTAYVDDEEAVLLPRVVHRMQDQEDEMNTKEPEFSPAFLFEDGDSISHGKNRYYESVMESTTTSFASPSPHHVMYPYTPNSASTVSLSHSSLSGYSPIGSIPPVINRDYVSAANLHAIVLEYLQEMFSYYDRARNFTFGHVGQMVQSVPFAFKYIQGVVKDRLGIPWQLVEQFVENILDFICDEDIRDATIMEFASFLCSIQEKLYENMPTGNIFGNLYEFFQRVLIQFKKYLIKQWLQIGKIMYPCEFGKKSNTLFLCMECHREHW